MVGKKFRKIMKNALLVGTSVVLFAGCTAGNTNEDKQDTKKDEPIKIGITQIIEHPALDGAREGFEAALEQEGFKDGENVQIDFQNAQGDMPTTQTIAQNFVSDQKDLIFAISTPSAQAAYNATKDTPIVISAVTDPQAAGLVKSFEKTETNVTGTSDRAPIDKQFKLLKKLIPNAKKVGIIYNTSETNSEVQVNHAKELAKDFGLEIITSGVTNVNEVAQALDELLGKVDALYTPADNIVASSMSLIASKCTEKQIPVIGAEEGHVKNGALATDGIDYYQSGLTAGKMAIEILNGKRPQDLPIATAENTQIVINKKTAEKLNIQIPDDLKEAEFVGGE